MKDEPQKSNADQTAGVRALIDRMEPGELLHLGEHPVAQYFYARLIPGKTSDRGKYIECLSPNFEALQQIQNMIENMVTAGELVETGDQWTWTLPSNR